MKVIVAIVFSALLVWYFGFYSKDAFFKDYSGQSGYFGNSKLCTDLEPKDPFARGTGEYTGFEWAKTNRATSCQSDSLTFTRGCNEYLAQFAAFQRCAQN